MKVLCISRAYRQNAGGMERLSYELIRELHAQPVLTTTHIAYSGPRLYFPVYFCIMLPRIIWRASGADLIHLGDPVLAIFGWIIKKILKKKIVVTVHGLDVTYASMIYRWYLGSFFRNFDLYLPISRHAATLLTPWQVRGKVTVITPGMSDRFYDPSTSRSALDQLLNTTTTGRLVLLTTGRLVKRKGHEWFIRQVLPHLPSTTLYVIAGAGVELSALQSAIQELGLSRQVRLLGRVSDTDLATLYNTIDIFIQPNIQVHHDAEGFGLVLLEAALCNRPVVASDIDGISDAITPEQNGTLLPAGNAAVWIKYLQEGIVTPTQAREYTLQKFNWRRQGQKIAEKFLTLHS